MRKKVYQCIAAVALLCAAPERAWALCALPYLSGLPATSTFSSGAGEYRVFDPSQPVQSVSFDVFAVAGVLGCRYYVTLDAGGSGNPAARRMMRGTETLDYNVYTTAATNNILNSGGSYGGAQVISGSFDYVLSLLQSATHSLYWTIPPQQIKPAGATRFADTSVTLRLWAELALGIFTNVDEMQITFQARVESDVDLSLVDSGAPLNLSDTAQTVDFGDLETGKVRLYDTMVRSNDGYSVTLESQNGQVLRHQNHPAVPREIPYTLTIDGAAVDLTGGGAVEALATTGVTPLSGHRLPTQFTIGTLDGDEPPGNYQDIVTVTVSAH